MEWNSFKKELLSLMRSINPNEFDYEKDFQEKLASLLGEKYDQEMEVKTYPLEEEKKFSRVDIVVRIADQYIPIELKYRREEQETEGYAQDYIDDIDRISNLMKLYDDVPYGFAICLTDDENIKEQSNEYCLVHNAENGLYSYRNMMCIEWEYIRNKEFAFGIAGWRWGDNKNPKSGYLLKDELNK